MEKSWHKSKKFLAFLAMELVFGSLAAYFMFRVATDAIPWTATLVLFALIFNMGFIAVAFNLSQARLDAYVRLAEITGHATAKLPDLSRNES